MTSGVSIVLQQNGIINDLPGIWRILPSGIVASGISKSVHATGAGSIRQTLPYFTR